MKRVVGSCNGCGLCCKVIALPIPHEAAYVHVGPSVILPRLRVIPERWRIYLEAHGVQIGPKHLLVRVDAEYPEPVRVGHYGPGLVLFVRSRCQQLTDDNQCRIHNTPGFPDVCRDYPTVLDDLSVVKPECGFDIIED